MNDRFKPQWHLIQTLRNIILAGLITNLFFLWIQPDHYPNNTFLCNPSKRFSDFIIWIQFQKYSLASEWGCPPFSLLVATFWKEIAGVTGSLVGFCLYSILFLSLHSRIIFLELGLCGKRPDFSTWAILSFLSYPVLFEFDRGNPAWMVYLSIYAFFYFCRRDKYQWAAFFLAIAISIKIIPVLFLFYLFYKGKWGAAICSLLETVLLTFVGYFIFSHFFYPAYSMDLFVNGLKTYELIYAIGGGGLAFSCSFFSLILLLLRFYAHIFDLSPAPFSWERIALTYCNAFTIGAMASVYTWIWLRRRKMNEHRVSSLLILCLLLVPPVTGDYYLLLCYLLFFDLLRLDLDSISFKIYSVCLGLLMIPKAYGVFFDDVNTGVLLNPLLLIVLLLCLLFSGQKRSYRDDIGLKTLHNSSSLSNSMTNRVS